MARSVGRLAAWGQGPPRGRAAGLRTPADAAAADSAVAGAAAVTAAASAAAAWAASAAAASAAALAAAVTAAAPAAAATAAAPAAAAIAAALAAAATAVAPAVGTAVGTAAGTAVWEPRRTRFLQVVVGQFRFSGVVATASLGSACPPAAASPHWKLSPVVVQPPHSARAIAGPGTAGQWSPGLSSTKGRVATVGGQGRRGWGRPCRAALDPQEQARTELAFLGSTSPAPRRPLQRPRLLLPRARRWLPGAGRRTSPRGPGHLAACSRLSVASQGSSRSTAPSPATRPPPPTRPGHRPSCRRRRRRASGRRPTPPPQRPSGSIPGYPPRTSGHPSRRSAGASKPPWST
mmetsp:Transcript_67086/g.173904  ORF Transcript_67086/g.173904 Transcript_67086/m.173904 type:complete len:348 (+) Transcript_67086:637-1680(+)